MLTAKVVPATGWFCPECGLFHGIPPVDAEIDPEVKEHLESEGVSIDCVIRIQVPHGATRFCLRCEIPVTLTTM